MTKFKLAAIAGAALFSTSAYAHSFTQGDIVVAHPWTRATPAGTSVGVAYLKITNKGKDADVLTGVAFDGAASVEVHEMKTEGDKMIMRELKDGVEVKPGETVELKPQGIHLMLMGLAKPIAEGPNVKGSLTFKNAGTLNVTFQVEPVGAMSSMDHHH